MPADGNRSAQDVFQYHFIEGNALYEVVGQKFHVVIFRKVEDMRLHYDGRRFVDQVAGVVDVPVKFGVIHLFVALVHRLFYNFVIF